MIDMATRSKVDQLPETLRERIAGLLREGVTLDAIMGVLDGLGVTEISRSSLGRWAARQSAWRDRLTRSRETARMLVQETGKDEGRTAQANLEMMQELVLQTLIATGEGEGATLDAKTMATLARMLDDLAAAQRKQQDFVVKIRDEAEARAKKAAAGAVERVGRERGLSAETVQAIRAQILGVKAA
jgi:hypothetical protein